MSKVYVVVERTYEYNDEVNYFNDGGQPVTVYRSEEKANEVVKEKTIQWLMSGNCSGFGHELNWLFGYNDDKVSEILGIERPYDIETMSREEAELVLRYLEEFPFYVRIVDIDENL